MMVFRVNAMRIASGVTALNVLVASGFALAGLLDPQSIVPPGDTANHASLVFALYAAARTIPLALFVLYAVYRQNAGSLLLLGSLAGTIQVFDGGIGIMLHDSGKAIGPLVIAALQFAALFNLRASRLPRD